MKRGLTVTLDMTRFFREPGDAGVKNHPGLNVLP